MTDYIKTIIDKVTNGELMSVPQTVHHIVVYHDDWCSLLHGGKGCNCEPEIKPAKAAKA